MSVVQGGSHLFTNFFSLNLNSFTNECNVLFCKGSVSKKSYILNYFIKRTFSGRFFLIFFIFSIHILVVHNICSPRAFLYFTSIVQSWFCPSLVKSSRVSIHIFENLNILKMLPIFQKLAKSKSELMHIFKPLPLL